MLELLDFEVRNRANAEAFDRLEKIADDWAESINLEATVLNIVNDREAVEAHIRQAFMEGALRGAEAGTLHGAKNKPSAP